MQNYVKEVEIIPRINYLVFRKCPAGWHIPPHLVDDYDITYVISGNAQYTINDKVYDLAPGDLLCLSDGDKKEAITYSDRLMHCFSVNFRLYNAPHGGGGGGVLTITVL
ncbi:MAG: AraC family ligand binding domain-containing protein [Treponema sp.]|jgi:gentisate 1,2-dioxygenase|nr:AraC family ligand binding domain-containing protein [Treponema sp.]